MTIIHKHHLSISEILASCLMKHRNFREDQYWQAHYDISILLQCTPALTGNLRLELCFQDQLNHRKVLITQCQGTNKSIHLLTKRCKLNVKGKINYAELIISTSNAHILTITESSILLANETSDCHL